MGAEMPALHEAGERQLRDGCRVAVKQCARDGHWLHQLRRQHGVPDPKPRKEGFREGADVDGPVMRIEALHARCRFAGIMKFTVVIVLNDPGLMSRRPFDERKTTIQRQRRPGRELM